MSQEIFYRASVLGNDAIDKENRRATLSFSSESPYQRSFGVEVLSHKSGDVDMEFLNSGNAPLLLEHDPKQQIGVVESATIRNGRGEAVVRFSGSALGEEVWKDVADGIRKNISVGYVITEKKQERNGDQVTMRCKWIPKEISCVSIPADESIGVGRAADSTVENNNNKDSQMEIENKKEDVAEVRAEVKLDTQAIINTERSRVAAITELTKRYNTEAIAQDLINSGRSVDEARAAILEELGKRSAVTVQTSAAIGMSDKEVRSYSLGRAINAMVTGDWQDAGLELEASRAAAKAQGKLQTRSNLIVPADFLTRDAGANAFTAAGNPAVVNTTKVGFMDTLFNKSIATKLGVQYMSGLNGTVEFPKLTAGVTARFVNEGVDGTIDEPTTDVVEIKPRTLVAAAELTRSMVMNSTAMESRIQANIQKAVAQRLEQEIFLKMVADTGINWITKPTAVAYADLLAVIKAVELENALTDNSKFAFDVAIKSLLAATLEETGTTNDRLYAKDGTVAGYGSETSINVGNNLIFGDFSEVVVGNWSTLELAVDTSQKFLSGGFILRALIDADVGILRPEAFAGYKALI